MRYKFASILSLVVLFAYSKTILSDNSQIMQNSVQLPPIETLYLEPIELEKINAWVPADKVGPLINRACIPEKNCLHSCALPSVVYHTKTTHCPKEIARLLAEYTAYYCEQRLPLTICHGWRWEHSYGLCLLKRVTCDLPERGGSWENSWEAILTQIVGSADFQWAQISPSNKLPDKSDDIKQNSSIEIRTFGHMRRRDGYPKKRQF